MQTQTHTSLKDSIIVALSQTDLAIELSEHPNILELVGDITLRELCSEAAPTPRKSRPATRIAHVMNGSAPDVRSRAGRAAFDASLLQAVLSSKAPIGATELVESSGANFEQVRTSLHRLIRQGKISRTGNTRATRYAPPARGGASAASRTPQASLLRSWTAATVQGGASAASRAPRAPSASSSKGKAPAKPKAQRSARAPAKKASAKSR